MDVDDYGVSSGWSRKCLCGKSFQQVNSYSNHIKSCKAYKSSVGATLEEAKARYQTRKSKKERRGQGLKSWFDDDDLDVDHVQPAAGPSSAASQHIQAQTTQERTIGRHSFQEGDPLAMSVGEGRPGSETGQEQPEEEMEIDIPHIEYGRGHRVYVPVQRYKDFTATSTIPFAIPSTLPEEETVANLGPAQLHSAPVDAEAEKDVSPSEVLRRTVFDDLSWKKTPANQFGLYKRYWTLESRPHDPDSYITSDDLREEEDEEDEEGGADGEGGAGEEGGTDGADGAGGEGGDGKEGEAGEAMSEPSKVTSFFPFPNWSSFRIGEWYWDDSQEKGRESFNNLIDILTSDNFSTQDIRDANWEKINRLLAASEFDNGADGFEWTDDGSSWQTAVVQIEVPFNTTSLRPGVHRYEVPGFRYRPLIPIITERLKDTARGDYFHIVPSELRWRSSDDGGPGVQVHGELYNSPAFLEAYKEVQSLPPEVDEDSLPRSVVALMFASDETMLAQFGTSKVWPIYMMFGNESKYRRGKSSLKLFEEVAYLQSVPDDFQDWYLKLSGKKNVGNPLSTHINRELFHAQWKILLDEDFVQAYNHGIVVDCFDGVRRRFYPRILTYSADYPERVTVVGIRNMGDHPCPRCLVALPDIPALGTPEDMAVRRDQRRRDDEERKKKVDGAREIINKLHYTVNTDAVEKLLKPTSLVPSTNAFSSRLSSSGLDVYSLIATDVLHEVEIGAWKSLFIQLLRLLEAIDKSSLNVLNARFRQIPTFGRDTIRRFRSNVSEMKQLAARDYEDILQCCLAVFEGLIPVEHGDQVQDLLFVFAHWHALAKLKLHTDDTLSILDEWTQMLGAESRLFVERTCSTFETRELKREYQARKRNEARKKGASVKAGVAQTAKTPAAGEAGNPESSEPPEVQKDLTANAKKPSTAMAKKPSTAMAKKPSTAKAKKPSTVKARNNTSAPATTLAPELALASPALSSPAAALEPEVPAQSLSEERDLHIPSGAGGSDEDSRKLRTWSLHTSKFHALGDVANYIRRFGSTDSYSTQLSERFHRFPKARYRRTNKKQTAYQLSRIHTRQARIKKLKRQVSPAPEEGVSDRDLSPYFIGKSQNKPVSLSYFLRVNTYDPAIKNFFSKLKRHLLPRVIERLLQEVRMSPEDYPPIVLPTLTNLHTTGIYSPAHFNGVYLHADRFYTHSILQVNYTTYDCRRAQDTLNPSTSRRYVMCLRAQDSPDVAPNPGQRTEVSHSSGSRFIYGQILAVFHVNVIYGGPTMLDHRPRRFDLLWVRWFDPLDAQFSNSNLWSSKRMERISLRPLSHSEACDFIDPSSVIRAAHIIPRFSKGMKYGEGTTQGRIASKCAKDEADWNEYFVNPFVDRDMLMRFHWGLGVGHIYAHGTGSDNGTPLADTRSHNEDGVPVGVTSECLTTPAVLFTDVPGAEVGAMDVDLAGGEVQATNSEDSAYDRPLGSDVLADEAVWGGSRASDVQGSDSSEEEDGVFQ